MYLQLLIYHLFSENFFWIVDGYAPFLSLTSRLSAFNESNDSIPAPGQYDSSPVKVL